MNQDAEILGAEILSPLIEKLEISLDADYLKLDINEPIQIYQGEFILIVNDLEEISFVGEVNLDWAPSLTIKISGESFDVRRNVVLLKSLESDNKFKVKIPTYMEEQAIVNKCSIKPNSISVIAEIKNVLQQHPERVSSVKCAIVNFENTHGQFVRHKSVAVSNRNKITIDEWEVILDKRPDYDKKIDKKLESSGGYAITHLCQIRRSDGQDFEVSDILNLEESLHWTLSFASGRHVGVCIFEGYQTDNLVWRKYQTPIIDKWKYRKTWFPNKEWKALVTIFPLIYLKLQDEYWGNVLKNIFGWYLECQSDGITEHKIVSNQIALESLAWSYLVESEMILEEKDYSDMSRKRASDIFRLFFNQYSSNIEIPINFPYLKEVKKLNLTDTAHLLTDYRNNIVHPRKKEKFDSLPDDFSFYVLRLGLHYLEFAILFILKYEGKIVNQLYYGWDGKYDEVTWKESHRLNNKNDS